MKVKRENKFLIFLLSIIVVVFFFLAGPKSIIDKILSNQAIVNFLDRVTLKSVEINDCVVEYECSKTNFKFANRNISPGHENSNSAELEFASIEMCYCLGDNCSLNNAEAIDFIVNVLRNDTMRLAWYYDYYLQDNFFSSIDSIIKYKETIFENDTFTLSLIEKYEINNDSILIKQILEPFLIKEPITYLPEVIINSEFIEIKNLLNLIREIELQGICKVYERVFFNIGIL